MSINVSSISTAICSGGIDPEHQRIMRELRALGIEPTGDKNTDKSKLETAKAAQRVENNQQIVFKPVESSSEADKNQAFSAQDEAKASITASAQNMTGADNIAQYNKFKLLGIY